MTAMKYRPGQLLSALELNHAPGDIWKLRRRAEELIPEMTICRNEPPRDRRQARGPVISEKCLGPSDATDACVEFTEDVDAS